ncbi:MAG: retroviral-like aspartic protease family protein [Armatimonadetes bacterium]|nr:retroviral-like aspartic protease family protein [Armatimonadota bacterium]
MAIFRFDPASRSIQLIAYASNGQVVRLAMALDTGATQTTIPVWEAKRMRLRASPRQPSVVTVTAEGSVTSPVYELPHLRVVGQTVQGLQVTALDIPVAAGVDSLLGLNFLRHFILIVNFPKGRLALLSSNRNLFHRLCGFIGLMRVYW